MEETKTSHQCLNCERAETDVPLVSLRYAGNQNWICTQCLPTLIHQPQRLAGKLAATEKVAPLPSSEP
jgi:hypothetical protein